MSLVNQINGRDGNIEVVGLGAVIALIQQWTLTRRADPGSDEPTWDLRASFSYQNETLIKNAGLRRRLTLKFDSKTTYEAEAIDGVEWVLENNGLMIKGVRAWAK